MTTRRIHVVGAPGAGTTTLGRALADALAVSHHDTDDYFWRPTSPPYRETREIPERLDLMRAVFLESPSWILSGSLDDWGATVVPYFDAVAFLYVPTELRLRRLWEREARKFGLAAVAPGGWRHAETESFIEWASHYDDGTREGRHLRRHQAWLETLTCAVLRFDGTKPVETLVQKVLAALP